MSRRFIIAIAALILALPSLALLPSLAPSSASAVPVQFGPGTTPGTITTATIGGVTGPVTWVGDAWTMTVAGQTFAMGTLNTLTDQVTITSMPGLASCKAGCTTTLSPTTLTGPLTGQVGFVNHGAWVSAVAHWGTANGISNRGALVSGAAKATTHKATGDPPTTSTTTNSTTGGGSGRHGGSGHNAVSGNAGGGAGTSGGGHSHGGGNSDLASAGLNAGGGGGGGGHGGDHGGGSHGR